MTNMKTELSLPVSVLTGPGHVKKNDVAAASREFEGLLLSEMLKMTRSEEGSLLGAGGDESSSPAVDYGIEMMARAIAGSGGLGLSAVIEKSLSHKPR